MKRILLVFAAMVFAAVYMDAQVANAPLSNGAAEILYKSGNLYQDGQKLSSDQVLQLLGQDVYDRSYKPAKGMRTAGIVILSVGAAVTAFGAYTAIEGAVVSKKSEPGSVLGGGVAEAFGIVIVAGGAVVGAVGGTLLGVGSKRIKKLVPASSGAGLALAF